MGCLQTTSTLVLVNGSSSQQFRMNRGFRHGDPLTPFLFLILLRGLGV